jgi:hypothetical protein
MTLRTPQKQVAPQIQAAPKKSTVRSTIEENKKDNEPSTTTHTGPRPTPQPAKTPSSIEAPPLSSNPSKMLLEMVIIIVKQNRDKLIVKKQISAGLRNEVALKLDDIVSFMEVLQAIEDNMATVKYELREVKEIIAETARKAQAKLNIWAMVAAVPRPITHHHYHYK